MTKIPRGNKIKRTVRHKFVIFLTAIVLLLICLIAIMMFQLPKWYKIDVLVIHKEGADTYQEVVQNYMQSFYVGIHVDSVAIGQNEKYNLKDYDLVYFDISINNVGDMYSLGNLIESVTKYVRTGGTLFLEGNLCDLFNKDFIGMDSINTVSPFNTSLTFPDVPSKYIKLQSLWKEFVVRGDYRENRGIYESGHVPKLEPMDQQIVAAVRQAVPKNAVSLVNSKKGGSLFAVNRYGRGYVIWTSGHIPKRGENFITRFDLGYPDSNAKNFHWGYATINFLMRNFLLDFIAKEKYGFSIQKVYGAYGRPSFCWQNHFEGGDAYIKDVAITWTKILKSRNQIPSFYLLYRIGGWPDGEENAIDSSQYIEHVKRNVDYLLKNDVTIGPHIYVKQDETASDEQKEIELYKHGFEQLEIPWSNSIGINHHGFSAHSRPVWQTPYLEKECGILYDFGWGSLDSSDFGYSYFCCTAPYTPYCIPFVWTEDSADSYPFVLWSPLPGEYVTYHGKITRYAFPLAFDLPMTLFFHPEHIYKDAYSQEKADEIWTHIQHTQGYAANFDELSLGHKQLIRQVDQFRDRYKYNVMSEEQFAKCMVNTVFSDIEIKLQGNALILNPSFENVPESALEYKGSLGVKIEFSEPIKNGNVLTDSAIYYIPFSENSICLGVTGKTKVRFGNYKKKMGFHIVRANSAFSVKESEDAINVIFNGKGLREIEFYCPDFRLQLSEEQGGDTRLISKENYYTLTNFGSGQEEIALLKSERLP